jgi:hypothetical protein
MDPVRSSPKHLEPASADVRPGVSPLLKLTTAVLAGVALLAGSGQARAGYVSSLGFDASSALGAAAAEPTFFAPNTRERGYTSHVPVHLHPVLWPQR